MKLLHGTVAPDGDGMVVEVHLDMMEAPPAFLQGLSMLGFEDDPFLDFFPPQYRHHYTGRTRVRQNELRIALPPIEKMVMEILERARHEDVRMYAESELVRSIIHFEDETFRSIATLELFTFEPDPLNSPAKADVHVEFRKDTVPEAVRALLEARGFYWVSTPASDRFPAEEIATLQTTTFADASHVFDRLSDEPPPACTGIHLEQKLGMIPSHPNLPMPPVMKVTALV